MLLSVIIPAFNEAAYLPATLAHVGLAKSRLESESGVAVEVLVVDNNSDDGTAGIVRSHQVRLTSESERCVAKVRNTGARVSSGDVLVFIDADTLVPSELLKLIAKVMSDPACAGGAVDTKYEPKKPSMRIYLKFWGLVGKVFGLAQGATQFCRQDLFEELSGYDEALFMGEDVDFFWRLRRCANKLNLHTVLIKEIQVVPSTRRFDQWHTWRTLIWTNPIFILLFRKLRTPWKGWYEAAPR